LFVYTALLRSRYCAVHDTTRGCATTLIKLPYLSITKP